MSGRAFLLRRQDMSYLGFAKIIGIIFLFAFVVVNWVVIFKIILSSLLIVLIVGLICFIYIIMSGVHGEPDNSLTKK